MTKSQDLRTNSGSLAIFAAIRRASPDPECDGIAELVTRVHSAKPENFCMEIGGRSFATQDKIERGTFQPMSPRKCALVAFPFYRGSEQKKKVVAF